MSEGTLSLPLSRRSLLIVFGVTLMATLTAALIGLVAFNGWAATPLWLPWATFAAALATVAAAATCAMVNLRRDGQRRLLVDSYEAAGAAYVISRKDGAVVHANDAARRLFGVGHLSSLTQIERVLAEDDAALARFRRWRRSAESGAGFGGEVRRRRADGSVVWWMVAAKPLARWPGHMQWRFEDITVRREIELILREEQIKLVDFMDHAPVGFYSVDQDGAFLFANATLADWLGVDARELVRGNYRLHDFILPPPQEAPPYALVEQGSNLPALDVLMRGRDERPIQASVAQTVVRSEDGRSVWTRSVVRDLTHEREMREKLRASEDRFRRFFEDAPIGIALLDQDAHITEWNKALQSMLGVNHDGLTGHSIADLVADDRRHDIIRRLSAVLGGAEARTPIELRMRGGRGDLVVALYAKRLDGTMEESPGLLLQFINQTDQKNLEAQFAQSQKMQAVGQLAGGIAHDFNNLLTAMIGFCDLLLMRHKPGDPSFGDIMQIKQNANRAANLVRQLLAFSRQQKLQPRVLSVTDVLAELSNLLRRLIGENIELKLIHDRDLGPVLVDQGQLEQVIINLAVNARDAMANGGQLTVRTKNTTTTQAMSRGSEEMPPGQYTLISISDTGVGIPPENLDRIFDPFFSTKEVGSGTGLGLSTVYGIVRQTGGYIFVESAPGQGANFSIYLPQHVATDAAVEAVPAEAVESRPRDLTGVGRILLVEDEDAVRVFGARALRNKGYEVAEADSGERALELLHQEGREVDLLITDIVMPQMDGPTLIRKVQEFRPDIKVICISGYAEDKFRQRLDADESIQFLAKPFSLKQLAAKVKDVLRPQEAPRQSA